MAKKTTRTASPKSTDTSFTIDLEKLMVPASILLSGLMISISTFLGIRSIGDTALFSGSGTAQTTNAADQTVIPNVTTNISDNPVKGDKTTAKVAIVEFSDYECPYCKLFYQQTYASLIKNYVDTGKAIYVFRNYIAVPTHKPAATLEAEATMCVQKLAGDAKYYEFHDYVFNNTGSNGAGITGGQDAIVNQAATLGIDKSRFTECLTSTEIANKISQDETDAASASQSGTPGFVLGKLNSDGTVSGYTVIGAQPLSTFQGILDQLLSE